jgi:PAS domain S-box-containing protein
MVDDELRSRVHAQALVLEVNAALAAVRDPEAVLEPLLLRLRERCRLARASIYLLESEGRVLRCVAESGLPSVDSNRAWGLDGPGLVAWAARTAEPLYVPDVSREPRCLCEDPATRTEYAAPLRQGSSLLGILDVQSTQLDGLRAVTRKLVDQVATQVALALERSELYKKLRISEERFRSIFEQDDLGVMLCDLGGRFSKVNPAFAKFLGYDPGDLRGRHYADLTHPEDRAGSLERTKALTESGQDHATWEKRYLHKSGGTVWGRTVMTTMRDAAGRPAGLMVMVEDISREKKVEESLSQAQKMEVIGTLAGGLAHDFNNSLAVILGFASLVRGRLAPEDSLQESVSMIEESVRSAADLTRQLLGLARHDQRERVHVNVDEVLRRVTKIVTRTFDRRIQVEARLVPELPAVEAEATQLEHALLNLCSNARDAMPEGGHLTIETSRVTLGPEDSLRPPQCSPGNYVQIAVRDTGLGIAPQALPYVFEPLFTTKEPGRGSGLGLAMVHRIVRSYGGFVRVESEVVRGSQFSLYLPAVERAPQPSTCTEPTQLEYGSGTVLVVDDEPLILAFAQRGLEKLGYDVLTADGGERACEIYATRAQNIDCILLDMVMPKISGLETYHKLREINPQARIILSSGYSMDRIAREVREMGAVDFLGKPYSLETLSVALKKAR